jgi:dihydrofolate reductase
MSPAFKIIGILLSYQNFTMPIFHAIAAMSENRVIGNQGKIPWHIPEDFRWFKHATKGGTLIMGRKTYESIGKDLPGRVTQILSRLPNKSINSKICVGENVIFDDTNKLPEPRWICGGSEIYEAFLPRSQTLYLTVVKQNYEGDTFFPKFEDKFRLEKLLYENDLFRIEFWVNNKVEDPAIYPPIKWPLPN